MKKIAIVVQRCGKEVVGGSEGYAFQMADVLSDTFDIDVLTTTAKDYLTWENYYNEGVEEVSERFRICRFSVDFQREAYWHDLNRVLFDGLFLDRFSVLSKTGKSNFLKMLDHRPIGLQDEWMRLQGPYSSSLLQYIKEKEEDYDIFVFMTYLYPTTFFGISLLKDIKKVFIIPTLHDEPPAYLNILKKYAAYNFLFLTKAEQKLAVEIFQLKKQSEVIGFGLEDKSEKINCKGRNEDYILYAGRLEGSKGVEKLYEHFVTFSKKNPDIKLFTIGDGPLKDYKHPNIEYLGFVSEEEKLSLMNGAIAFIHPSAYESLGIVLLESFMMGTPALVNRYSEVLSDHILDSGAGYCYASYEEFEKHLTALAHDKELRNKLGSKAREYFLNNYSKSLYTSRLESVLAQVKKNI